jgi:disulfide bond formation protein DsbB
MKKNIKLEILLLICFIIQSILGYSQNQEIWFLMKNHNETFNDCNTIFGYEC